MKIGLCPLSEGTLFSFLMSLGYSKTFLKKSFSKNQLDQIIKDEIEISIDILNLNMINPHYVGEKVKVLFESSEFLVLHKPEKIHCFPQTYSEQNNILSFIRENNYNEILNVDQLNPARGLLYRLDYETSGVLVLVKDQQQHHSLRQNFNQQMKKKSYLAIVEGEFDHKLNLIHYLKPFGVKGSKMKCYDQPVNDCQKAEIHIKLRSFNKDKNLSLIEVNLVEGIRHQIRTQLSHIGFPILGDIFYGGKPADRVYLHAYQYQLDEKTIFESKEFELFHNFFNFDGFL